MGKCILQFLSVAFVSFLLLLIFVLEKTFSISESVLVSSGIVEFTKGTKRG